MQCRTEKSFFEIFTICPWNSYDFKLDRFWIFHCWGSLWSGFLLFIKIALTELWSIRLPCHLKATWKKKAFFKQIIFLCIWHLYRFTIQKRAQKRNDGNGILFPNLFWPSVRFFFLSCDREKLLKIKAEGREFSKIWDHWNNLFEQWKVSYNFWNALIFLFVPRDFSDLIIRIQIGKKILGFRNLEEKLEKIVSVILKVFLDTQINLFSQ